MRVEVIAEGNLKIVLDIMFRRTNKYERRKYHKKELIDTACIISRDGRLLACQFARQNPLDDYNKIVGKKIALAKAIGQIEWLQRIPHLLTTSHTRMVMRSRIWEAFHQTFHRWN